LVEDALFCHRCGKAQRDLVPRDDEALESLSGADTAVFQQPLPPPPAAVIALPISFRNTVAVRIGFLVASIASVLDAIPTLNMLFVIWSVCAGFVAVVLYSRTTGHSFSIRDGARMGWITGILNSLIIVVLFTVSMVTSSAELTNVLKEQVRTMAPNDANALSLIESPYAIATIILFTLLMMVVLFTGACVAGGALGARITRDESRSQLR
jgi:ABC-type proline/glycine betaine transport system permease subunit